MLSDEELIDVDPEDDEDFEEDFDDEDFEEDFDDEDFDFDEDDDGYSEREE